MLDHIASTQHAQLEQQAAQKAQAVAAMEYAIGRSSAASSEKRTLLEQLGRVQATLLSEAMVAATAMEAAERAASGLRTELEAGARRADEADRRGEAATLANDELEARAAELAAKLSEAETELKLRGEALARSEASATELRAERGMATMPAVAPSRVRGARRARRAYSMRS